MVNKSIFEEYRTGGNAEPQGTMNLKVFTPTWLSLWWELWSHLPYFSQYHMHYANIVLQNISTEYITGMLKISQKMSLFIMKWIWHKLQKADDIDMYYHFWTDLRNNDQCAIWNTKMVTYVFEILCKIKWKYYRKRIMIK